MQIANYGKRFIQYILYGYLKQLQKSTKMLQKNHQAQNRSISFAFRPIFVHKNKLHYLTEPCFL
jgi:hypothetical protein